MLEAVVGLLVALLGEIFRFGIQSLEVFAIGLQKRLFIPWPLVVALFFPPVAMALNFVVWVLRGRVWRTDCAYHDTITRNSCRNPVFGEWSHCHYHRRGWKRATDGHVVDPAVRRWQQHDDTGEVVDREDALGLGVFRLRPQRVGLLYVQGFTKPPGDVFREVRPDLRRRRDHFRAVLGRLHKLGLRGVLRPSTASPATIASMEGPGAVRAAQAALALTLIGLLGIIVAITLGTGRPRAYVEYVVLFLFLTAFTVARQGILYASVERPGWALHSTREALSGWLALSIGAIIGAQTTAIRQAAGTATNLDPPVSLAFVFFAAYLIVNRRGRRRTGTRRPRTRR